MNTETRRAVFCVVMGADDYLDAAERLLRLRLQAGQEREMVRVVLECCMQEKAYNPYYAHLLAHLCKGSKSHRTTAKFCAWDQWKELGGGGGEAGAVRRSTNLARCVGELLARGALTAAALTPVDFPSLGARATLHFRVLLEAALGGAAGGGAVEAAFAPLAASKHSGLRGALAPFLSAHVAAPGARPLLPGADAARLAKRAQVALRAMRGLAP